MKARDLLSLIIISKALKSYVSSSAKRELILLDKKCHHGNRSVSTHEFRSDFHRFYSLLSKTVVMVIGGYTDAFQMAALVIDEHDGHTWETKFPDMIISRFDFSAAFFQGEVFITSQSNAYLPEYGTTERYNISTSVWTRLKTLYPTPDNTGIGLSGQSICEYAGQLYVTGGYYDIRDPSTSGYDSDGPPDLIYNQHTYVLKDNKDDPALATWKILPQSIIQNRAAHASIEFEGKLLIGGGVWMIFSGLLITF